MKLMPTEWFEALMKSLDNAFESSFVFGSLYVSCAHHVRQVNIHSSLSPSLYLFRLEALSKWPIKSLSRSKPKGVLAIQAHT